MSTYPDSPTVEHSPTGYTINIQIYNTHINKDKMSRGAMTLTNTQKDKLAKIHVDKQKSISTIK